MKKTQSSHEEQAIEPDAPQEQLDETLAQPNAEDIICPPDEHELISHIQRLQAEFDNYRKRVEREQTESKAHASDALLRELLPLLDNLDLALAHAKDEHGTIKGEDLLTGVTLIRDQLHHALEHQGLEEIPTNGMFDPRLHEALMTQQQENTSKGTILQTFQRGYTKYGKPFRAAKVSVAK